MAQVAPIELGVDGKEKKVTKTEEGLTDNVKALIETPEQMLSRVLMPGEVVKGEFECYFPTDFVPRWKIVLLLISTCGLYAFVLCFKRIQQWCYKIKCCTPRLVSFTRGLMAITSKGRVICWSEQVEQVKVPESKADKPWYDCFLPARMKGPPTDYVLQMDTSVFSATKIRQLSEIYTSSALCCCCCVDYDCMVEVSFEKFRPSTDKFVDVRSKWDFYGMIQSILDTGISAVEATVGISSNKQNVLYIVSGTQDAHHNGDIHSVLDDLNTLYTSIIKALPAKALPNVFLNTQKDVEAGKPKLTEGVKGVTIVADDRSVTIPCQWLSLLPDEEIITSHGEMFVMGCAEWILTLCSLGYAYCCDYRKRKVVRYGVVLTTKRVVVLDIFQRAGTVPEHLANVTVGVRSYFPGKVNAGYYSCTSDSKNEWMFRMCCISPPVSFKTGILTEAGEVSFKFSQTEMDALPFAKALQMTECRQATPIKYGRVVTADAIDYTDNDKNLMPLMPNEQLLDKVAGNPDPVPFCGDDSACGKLCMDFLRFTGMVQPEVKYCCSLENCGRNKFPCLPKFLTCGFYPFNLKKDLLITEYSLMSYVRKSRDCFCGSCCKSCQTIKDFGVVWVSNEMLIGHSLSIAAVGHENTQTRMWNGTICGRVCCPIGTSSYSLVVQMEKNMSFSIGFTDRNAQWLSDASLLKNLRVLDNVQMANYEKDHAVPEPVTAVPAVKEAEVMENRAEEAKV